MKKNDKPIPVRSVIAVPRWLMVSVAVLSLAFGLGCVATIVYGAMMVDDTGSRWGYIGGGFGGLIGCAGAVVGTLCDWSRRLPATLLLRLVQNDAPAPFYRVFWPSTAAFVLGLGLLFCCERFVWQPLLQLGGILAFLSGAMEVIRRHTTNQARALFALYADGALDPADTAAIEDARAKDPQFDAEVRAFQELGARIEQLTAKPR
jgi:hypothetical protein